MKLGSVIPLASASARIDTPNRSAIDDRSSPALTVYDADAPVATGPLATELAVEPGGGTVRSLPAGSQSGSTRPLALAISDAGTPVLWAMPHSVSPSFTRYSVDA